MDGRLHLGIDLVDGPVPINQVGDPMGALVLPAHELLGTPHAVGGKHVVALVAQQGKGEVVFLHKFLLLLRGISTDTGDLNAPFRVFPEFSTESLALGDSAGGVGLGEKPQDQPAAFEIAQGDRLSIGVGQGEGGGLGAGFE